MTARKQGSLYLIIAILFLLFGYWISQFSQTPPKAFKALTVLPKARILPKIPLDSINTKLDSQAFKGKWTWLFFGFTRCQGICPTTLQQMHVALERISGDRIDLPNVYMISIDPEREKIKEVEGYVQAFDKNFHGLVASSADLAVLTRMMGIVYFKERQQGGDPSNDNINHSGAIMLLNPDGQLAGFFNTPHDPNHIASDYQELVS